MSPHADGSPSRICLECERQLGWFKQKCTNSGPLTIR